MLRMFLTAVALVFAPTVALADAPYQAPLYWSVYEHHILKEQAGVPDNYIPESEFLANIDWVDANHQRLAVDAIIVTRGGGSMEDLWAFNERIVADAAFRCSIPLVAAIGHESDTTVIELVADLRAATPTQAAMRLVPSRDELGQQADHLGHRLAGHVRVAEITIENDPLEPHEVLADHRLVDPEIGPDTGEIFRLDHRIL